MGDQRRRERKAARRERAKRVERQRRLTADQCAILLWDADAAWNQRDYEDARRLLEKILHIRPNHRTAHERLAELHFSAGRSEEGLTHYDRLSHPPEWPVLTYQAAVANARLARFDRSRPLLDEFLKATSRQPEFKPLRASARALRQQWARMARQHAARAARGTHRVSTSSDRDGQLEIPSMRVAAEGPAPVAPATANGEGPARAGRWSCGKQGN
jgi:tetratricopeptide (TPR) repeat protein